MAYTDITSAEKKKQDYSEAVNNLYAKLEQRVNPKLLSDLKSRHSTIKTALSETFKEQEDRWYSRIENLENEVRVRTQNIRSLSLAEDGRRSDIRVLEQRIERLKAEIERYKQDIEGLKKDKETAELSDERARVAYRLYKRVLSETGDTRDTYVRQRAITAAGNMASAFLGLQVLNYGPSKTDKEDSTNK